ncbi:phosphoglycerate mutase family protein [Alistipes sp.]|uniref:phosphoglycerate mutase family protein n=1 Tax=Alistipes sp. TaxID=1872444 RepID=UPI003AB58FC3
MDYLMKTAAANQQRAREVIRDTGLEAAWRSVGAEPNLVGSLRTGLLMTHRDIDFHIYSSPLRIADSFAAMARLAGHPRIRQVTYNNLLDAPDQCLEWHAWYADADDKLWQIDMIHMPRGSAYDGYFEQVADRISAVLTDETRRAILQIKYDTPDGVKIMGIEYYQAVLRDGVRTYAEFEAWRAAHPVTGVLEWMP